MALDTLSILRNHNAQKQAQAKLLIDLPTEIIIFIVVRVGFSKDVLLNLRLVNRQLNDIILSYGPRILNDMAILQYRLAHAIFAPPKAITLKQMLYLHDITTWVEKLVTAIEATMTDSELAKRRVDWGLLLQAGLLLFGRTDASQTSRVVVPGVWISAHSYPSRLHTGAILRFTALEVHRTLFQDFSVEACLQVTQIMGTHRQLVSEIADQLTKSALGIRGVLAIEDNLLDRGMHVLRMTYDLDIAPSLRRVLKALAQFMVVLPSQRMPPLARGPDIANDDGDEQEQHFPSKTLSLLNTDYLVERLLTISRRNKIQQTSVGLSQHEHDGLAVATGRHLSSPDGPSDETDLQEANTTSTISETNLNVTQHLKLITTPTQMPLTTTTEKKV